ncbi:MAG: hypothetical protein LBL96_07610 [Clostridiales bacterium]|jgi:hypothetical protein|nr:hypothetical protein [Clostridiales bacterium]
MTPIPTSIPTPTQPQAANNKPQMLTLPQIDKLQILPGKALRWLVAENKIPVVKIGRRSYINLDLFKRYLAGELEERGAKTWQ